MSNTNSGSSSTRLRTNLSTFVFPYRNAVLIITLNLFLLVAGCIAQDTVTGAFQGDVSNNVTGDPLAGVLVQITNVETGLVYNLSTDSKGRFYQGLLAPGSYDIAVTVAGFKPRLLRREIKVSLTGEVVPVPVSLEPETAPSAQPAVLEQPGDIRVEINTTDARRGDSAKEEEITKIPLGSSTVTRSFDELALLMPGVAPPPQTIGDVAGPGVGPGVGSAGQFVVNGLRSRANNFTVDGSDNNDEDIGVRRQGFVALIPQPIESIKEFQLTTLLAPAQFGRNLGAQVNAVSRAGGNEFNGVLYGAFNSAQLNARNVFDTANGTETTPLRSASGQNVQFTNGEPLTVRNQSGGKDPFTFAQGGGTLGGAIRQNRLFYFISGEYQNVNASQEKSFAVPTLEQRGAFGTGATGTFRNPYTGAAVAAIPNTESSAALFSIFPFPNNPAGSYGPNTFTQVLPAGGRGVILSGRLDDSFSIAGRQNTFTARYNFTDDDKDIPAVNEAIFSTVRSRIRTDNISIFLNSQLNRSSSSSLFNQVRFSFGHTHLTFDEIRDRSFLIPSLAFPDIPFLLNAPLRFNITQPTAPGVPNSGPVLFSPFDPFAPARRDAESLLGPIGQISIAGFSSLGTDVYNFPQDRVNRTLQFADELTYRRGGHSFAMGFDIRRTVLSSDLPRLARPLVTFNGGPRLSVRVGQTCPNGGIANYCFPSPGDPNPVIRPEDLAAMGAASNFLLTFNIDRPDSKVNLLYHQLNFYGQDTWRVSPELSVSFGLRYEYNTPVRETDGLIERTFSDERLALVPGLRSFLEGRERLYEPDRNNFAPRFGVAYSPVLFGGNKVSVFRFGYGIFYDQVLGAVVNQSRNVFPTFLTVNLGGLSVFGDGLLNLTNPGVLGYPAANGEIIPVQLPGTINQFNPEVGLNNFIDSLNIIYPNAINATLPQRRLDMPMAHHYSFSFEQQLSSNYSFSVAYVGTSGNKLLRFTTPNLGSSLTTSPTTLITSPVPTPFGLLALPQNRGVTFIPNRPVNSVGAINRFETTASSTYNAMQAQLQGRFIKDLNFQFSYVYSKVTDDVSDVFDLAGAFVLPQNSMDLRAEHGPANFDVRHRWTYDFFYSLPRSEGKWFDHITKDLQIATVGKFHTGQPFTVNSTIDVNLDGNLTDRLNTLEGIEITGDRRQPLRLTTDDPFSLLAPFGQTGQIGRNSFRAGNVLEMDLSVIKPFTFGSRRLIFRTDVFNFINRANYGVPVRLLEAPGFGNAVSTVTPGRRVQFSLKYEF